MTTDNDPQPRAILDPSFDIFDVLRWATHTAYPEARIPETAMPPRETAEFDRKTEINKRVEARWAELMGEGKHGTYETLFRIVHEERANAVQEERDRAP